MVSMNHLTAFMKETDMKPYTDAFQHPPTGSNRPFCMSILLTALSLFWSSVVMAETVHVWEKVEVTLHTQKTYQNPYTDVTVWVDLRGPGFERRCYGFWDGGDTFRVRVLRQRRRVKRQRPAGDGPRASSTSTPRWTPRWTPTPAAPSRSPR